MVISLAGPLVPGGDLKWIFRKRFRLVSVNDRVLTLHSLAGISVLCFKTKFTNFFVGYLKFMESGYVIPPIPGTPRVTLLSESIAESTQSAQSYPHSRSSGGPNCRRNLAAFVPEIMKISSGILVAMTTITLNVLMFYDSMLQINCSVTHV